MALVGKKGWVERSSRLLHSTAFTPHTINTFHSLEMDICIVCAQYRLQLGLQNHWWSLNAVSCEQNCCFLLPSGVRVGWWRSRRQLLVAQLLLMLRPIAATWCWCPSRRFAGQSLIHSRVTCLTHIPLSVERKIPRRHGPKAIGQLAASEESARDYQGEGLDGGLGGLAGRLSCHHLFEAERKPHQVWGSRRYYIEPVLICL